MKNVAPCTSYKIGFFGLLTLIIILFGLFASSSLLKMTYKNRAVESELKASLPEVTDAPKNSNTEVLIATIPAFIKRQNEEVYDVTIEEVMFKPKPKAQTNPNVISFISSSDFKILEKQSEPRILTCSFFGKTILKPVEKPVMSDPTKSKLEGEVAPVIEIVEKLIDNKFLKDGYRGHTYLIDFIHDLDVTPNPGHQKLCTITRIMMQADVKEEVSNK